MTVHRLATGPSVLSDRGDPWLSFAGEEGAEAGAVVGAESGADGDTNLLSDTVTDADAWDVLEDIPPDTAAALILLEHHWAVPLRDAVLRAGEFRLGDAFISPLELVEIGMLKAEEQQLHDLESRTATPA